MGLIIAIVIIIAAAAFIMVAFIDAVRTARSPKRNPHEPFLDPTKCDHEWRTSDGGACITGYSSYGGPDPQETWTIMYCPHCGSQSFSCTGPCDNYTECIAPYERSYNS